MKYYLRLVRPTTMTTITVVSPLSNSPKMNTAVSAYLNGWVDSHYYGFQISDVWTEDQKLMHDIATV